MQREHRGERGDERHRDARERGGRDRLHPQRRGRRGDDPHGERVGGQERVVQRHHRAARRDVLRDLGVVVADDGDRQVVLGVEGDVGVEERLRQVWPTTDPTHSGLLIGSIPGRSPGARARDARRRSPGRRGGRSPRSPRRPRSGAPSAMRRSAGRDRPPSPAPPRAPNPRQGSAAKTSDGPSRKHRCIIARGSSGSSSAGRAQPSQGWGRGFDPRLPLHFHALRAGPDILVGS